MTTQGWIFLGLGIVLYFLFDKAMKKVKLNKLIGIPWYGKVIVTFFIIGLLFMAKALLVIGWNWLTN